MESTPWHIAWYTLLVTSSRCVTKFFSERERRVVEILKKWHVVFISNIKWKNTYHKITAKYNSALVWGFTQEIDTHWYSCWKRTKPLFAFLSKPQKNNISIKERTTILYENQYNSYWVAFVKRRTSQKLLNYPVTDPQISLSNNKLGTLVIAFSFVPNKTE